MLLQLEECLLVFLAMMFANIPGAKFIGKGILM
jgi:hypothetical protein